MTHATSDHARENWPCPQSRAFSKPQENCRGSKCPVWRWTTRGPWAEAVKKVAEEIDDKKAGRPAAAARVAADPEAHGCHGYCGLGGPV